MTAYVTSKGQVVIPVELRRRYRIKPGTKIHFIERGNEIVMQPVTKEFIRSLCGTYKSDESMTGELLKERARDRDREKAKFEKFRSR